MAVRADDIAFRDLGQYSGRPSAADHPRNRVSLRSWVAVIEVHRTWRELLVAVRAGLWLRVLDKDPFDESAHLELVGMLSRTGRHGEARRRFGVYVDRMEEIGVEAAPFPTPLRVA
jgi:hypothetical protein